MVHLAGHTDDAREEFLGLVHRRLCASSEALDDADSLVLQDLYIEVLRRNVSGGRLYSGQRINGDPGIANTRLGNLLQLRGDEEGALWARRRGALEAEAFDGLKHPRAYGRHQMVGGTLLSQFRPSEADVHVLLIV